MTASLTDTANKHDDVFERPENLSAQFATRVRREDVYKLELTAVKEDWVETRVERANVQRSVNELVTKVREASAALGRTLQAIVESSNRLSEDVADKFKSEMRHA